jgi:hypothetical protein
MNLVNEADDVKAERKPAGAPLTRRLGASGNPERMGIGAAGRADGFTARRGR